MVNLGGREAKITKSGMTNGGITKGGITNSGITNGGITNGGEQREQREQHECVSLGRGALLTPRIVW
jgi:hypothetical protein